MIATLIAVKKQASCCQSKQGCEPGLQPLKRWTIMMHRDMWQEEKARHLSRLPA